MKRFALALFLALFLALSAAPLRAESILELGTWVKRSQGNAPLVLTIEAAGTARRLTYRIRQASGRLDPNYEQVVVTQLDGQDAPLLDHGKPSGETMAIKRLDARHSFTVIKMNGKAIATSKAELSADGKLMTVENEYTGGGGMRPGKQMEYWDRK